MGREYLNKLGKLPATLHLLELKNQNLKTFLKSLKYSLTSKTINNSYATTYYMNYNSVRLLYFFIMLFFFQSCKKTEQPLTIVNGVVINIITNEPVKDIPIKITEAERGSGKYLTTTKIVYTDAAGKYSTAINWEKGKQYRIRMDFNNILGGIDYLYDIRKDTINTFNFSSYPLKTLNIHYKVLRHDKNWLVVGLESYDGIDFYSNTLFNGPNPVNNFDTTYQLLVPAGRPYRAQVVLINKVAPSTYQDYEYIYKLFEVKIIDTTKVEFIVP